MLKKVKGTKDFIEKEIEIYNAITDKFNELCKFYGFKMIKTPILEYTELFNRSIGEFTDIVNKEMYTFTNSKGKNISLRPENTAGVMRAYIENGMSSVAGEKKLYYYGPMFRHERPQAGRLRQFHQLGCEIIESYSYLADIELIVMAQNLLDDLKINGTELHINNIGCPVCRKEYLAILKKFLNKFENELCENCKIRKDSNALRVLDCKNKQCNEITQKSPKISEHLCETCNLHKVKINKQLDKLQINYIYNDNMVRGLDYYTQTAFEFKQNNLGAQDTVLAGGRYNGLCKQLGGQDTGAVGWAAGIERLMLAIEKSNINLLPKDNKEFFLIYEDTIEGFIPEYIKFLRNNNIHINYNYEIKSFKAQFRLVNKLNYDYILILGKNEVEKQGIKLKNMNNGDETFILKKDIIQKLHSIINNAQ